MPKRKTAKSKPAPKGVRVWVWSDIKYFERISITKPKLLSGRWSSPDAIVVCDDGLNLLRAVGVKQFKRTPAQYIIQRAIRVEDE